MIAQVLPGVVCSAEAFDDAAPAPLFAVEEELLAGAGPKRRREFATVRRCARKAMGELGIAPAPLLRGVGGAPVWPPGVRGSMTHCAGYRAAAVAGSAAVTAIGIDAEPAKPLPAGVLGLIAAPGERAALTALAAAAPDLCWDRLLFCAKEAVYKAWFPLTATWLGFRDATVDLEVDGTFHARLHPASRASGPDRFTGRWLARDGVLIAAIAT
ncbi:4'-phosphopantetheinyl transferase family protein [Actinophytocola sediminis]